MLILVGVTISYVVNGGLISKAKQAAKQTQIAADKELLEFDVILAVGADGTINFNEFRENATSDGFTVSGSSLPYTATSKNGNEFSVSLDGKVTYIGEGEVPSGTEDTELELLRKYCIGKSAAELLTDAEHMIFADGTGDASSVKGEDITFLDMDDDDDAIYVFIRYETSGNIYMITFIFDEESSGSELERIKVSSIEKYNETIDSGSGNGSDSDSGSSSGQDISNVGKYVTYNNIDYIVMTEDDINGTVDLISANAIQVNNSNVKLGYDDPGAIIAVPAVDENNPTDEENAERARWSYNNMVETLVTACKDATGLTVDGTDVISVRCVGNNNVKYTSSGITGNDSGTYTYDWQTAGASSDWYTENGYNSYNMKAEDNNYQSDCNIMDTLGILKSDNSVIYWLASRAVHGGSGAVFFSARSVNSNGSRGGYIILNMQYYDALPNELSYAIRPVVTISSILISNVSGSGTSSDPYVIQ